MKELNKEELLNVNGGASLLTASFLNAASRIISTILELGRSLGTSIIRSTTGRYCEASK